MRAPWSAALAGEAVREGLPAVWRLAMSGRPDAALHALASESGSLAEALRDALAARVHPAEPAATAPSDDPVVAWAIAQSITWRGGLPSPPRPGDDALYAEHLRLNAAARRDAQAASILKQLAARADAIGSRAALDLGARTPDRLLATRLLGDGLARARASGERLTVAHALRLLADRAVSDGRPAEAPPLLQRALRLDTAGGDLSGELATRRLLDAALVALRRDEARLEALHAWLDVATRAADRPLQGWIGAAIGHTGLATRHLDEALAGFALAAAVARELDDRDSLRADLEGLANAAERLGRSDAAQEAREEAATI